MGAALAAELVEGGRSAGLRRGGRQRRAPWSAREERALRQAVDAGYHGDWNGILRDPRWAEVLSRRDGKQLKDKARNMNLVRWR